MSAAMTARPVNAQPPARRLRLTPATLVVVAVATILALLVLQPVGWIEMNGWRDDLSGAWSSINYVRIFTTPTYIEPMINSLLLATSTAAIATLLGVPLAWLVARTNMPGRGLIRVLVLENGRSGRPVCGAAVHRQGLASAR